MRKRLTRVGNSLAIIIDRPILDLLKIGEDAEFDVATTDGRTLTITPTELRTARRPVAKRKMLGIAEAKVMK